jgi:hypothetical protein
MYRFLLMMCRSPVINKHDLCLNAFSIFSPFRANILVLIVQWNCLWFLCFKNINFYVGRLLVLLFLKFV